MPTTFVFSSTASHIASIRFARMLTRSRSAPGSSPAVISTTVTFAAERGVDAAELEPDVAAADDEQRLRDVGQIERAGRVHHARIVDAAAPGIVDGRDPVAMIACSNVSVSLAARRSSIVERVRVAERRHALDVLDLPQLRDLPGTAGELRRRPCS